MSTSAPIRGLIAALLTPYTDDGAALDERGLRAHVEWLLDRGVHGVMPCGTTGEGPLLDATERMRALEIVVETVAHRVPVIAHVGTADTRGTIALARHARACGADAVSAVTPYYFRLSQDALAEHFCRVADSVPDLPVFLYNIPQCTGNALSRAAVAEIAARSANVIGIKDSSGNLETLSSWVGIRDGKFTVLCGGDTILLKALDLGVCGAVSGNANVIPEALVGLFDAYWSGNGEAARRHQQSVERLCAALEDGRDLSLLKRALQLRGLSGGAVRRPLAPATDDQVARAEAALREARLI